MKPMRISFFSGASEPAAKAPCTATAAARASPFLMNVRRSSLTAPALIEQLPGLQAPWSASRDEAGDADGRRVGEAALRVTVTLPTIRAAALADNTMAGADEAVPLA